MYKLLSITNDEFTLNKLGGNNEQIDKLLKSLNLDGFEILKVEKFNESRISFEKYIGRHLYFYPMWYSFCNDLKDEILDDFNTFNNAYKYYRGKNRSDFIKNLKEELKDANNDGVQYVVLHISHMNLEEAYSYKYKHTSIEIVKSYVEIINEATKDLNLNFKLLLENNWYPGLNFLDKDVLQYILEKINYKNTYFLLDIGHLINTNLNINNEDKAIKYLYEVMGNIGKYKDYIEGIHLNLSLSGDYVKDIIKNYSYNPDFITSYIVKPQNITIYQ